MRTLVESTASLEEALSVYRTSTTGWETADSYFTNDSSPSNSSYQKVPDPGIQLHAVQPLPHAFTSQYNNVKYKSFMGLFPQINRAWLTVDSNLFLWAYAPFRAPAHPPDLYVFEGLSQIIVSVALVPPRPGVFVESVEYILVVATPVEVTLLGVTFSPSGELTLIPTQISVATDNTLMLKIMATPSGRIFMAGADGTLHEFVYEARPQSSLLDLLSGRPAKRARKIAHTGPSMVSYLIPSALKTLFTRSDEIVDLAIDGDVLYTLTQDGLLAVYNVHVGVKCIATVNVKHDVKSMILSMPSNDREFVSIHAVPARTSKSIQLIVVTSFGERIYYSTHAPITGVREAPQNLRPRTLRIASFRKCPDSNPRATRPCVHIAWCERGAAVFADLRENESDRLISVYPDASLTSLNPGGPDFRPGPVKTLEVVFENSLDVPDDGSNYQKNLSLNTPMTGTSTFNNAGTSGKTPTRTFAIAEAGMPEGADDDESPVESPAFFWVLTANAMHLYERIQPLNRLKEILSSGGGSHSDLKAFFSRHGAAEACSMCLEIAISQPTLTSASAKVFYSYGGDPQFDKSQGGPESTPRTPGDGYNRNPAFTSSSRGENGHDGGSSFDIGRPSLNAAPLTRFSGAHDGTAWYFAKIVHPLWTKFVTSDRNPEAYQRLAVSKELIGRVRDRLLSMVAFLEKYAPDTMLPEPNCDNERDERMVDSPPYSREDNQHHRPQHGGTDEHGEGREDSSMQHRLYRGIYQLKKTGAARRFETSSILGLKDLAIRAIEALALLLILVDHQLHRLIVSIPDNAKALLCRIRICDLVVSDEGSLVSVALIKSMFGTYRDGSGAVINIGRTLQERCPSYFGDSDLDLHQGLAYLRQALDRVENMRESTNENSMMMEGGYDTSAGSLDENVAATWAGAVSLAEDAAQIIKTVPDRVFDIAALCNDFSAVRAIPALVDVALTIGKSAEASHNEERAKNAYSCIIDALNPFVDGRSMGVGYTQGESFGALRDASMRVALNSKSEMFLSILYDHLLRSERGKEELLKRSSSSVERFLEEKGELDVLWRYCARHERHYEAAGVLLNLAESEREISLLNRLNFLTCALHNAKTAASKGDGRATALLSEISDCLDVAKVQLRVREELERNHSLTEEVQKSLKELDGEVLGLSKLFNDYARPFGLYEASLEAFKCGSYRDEAYVQGLWIGIVKREANLAKSAALLSEKMQSIGREFYPSDVAFPASFIIDVMEREMLKKQLQEGWSGMDWVVTTMQNIGVPLGDVVDGYRRMLETPMQVVGESWSWSEEHAQFHLLKVTERVIDRWLREEDGNEGYEMRSERERVMRAVSVCKSRLRGMSSPGVRELVQKLEKLESNIVRLNQFV